MSGASLSTKLVWNGGVSFAAETGSGHKLTTDGAPDSGGRNLGARPMELVLVGLGGCGGFDVVRQLREAGQEPDSIEVDINATRADTKPAVFENIHCVFTIKGRDINEEVVARAVRDSAEKHSSVSRMLEQSATVTYDYVIEEQQ